MFASTFQNPEGEETAEQKLWRAVIASTVEELVQRPTSSET
jgi:hypothetical protein